MTTPATTVVETTSRIERKFSIAPASVAFVGAWLAHAAEPHRNYPRGRVTSCYYDTMDMEHYMASVEGDHIKHKVRIRWYDDPPVSGWAPAWVELKRKEGLRSEKRRVPCRIPAAAIAAGHFHALMPPEQLLATLFTLGYDPPSPLRPTAVVTYRRARFADPHSGASVSLDTNIRAIATDPRVLPSVVDLPQALVEVKHQTIELPLRLLELRRFDLLWEGFSKYATAITLLQAHEDFPVLDER